MKLLFDARMPQSLAFEAASVADRGAFELVRWLGGDISDIELLESAAEQGFHGVVLLGRDSLAQAELRSVADRVGVAIIAVVADGPYEAKQRLVSNLVGVRRSLSEHNCLLVLANEVRPIDVGMSGADAC